MAALPGCEDRAPASAGRLEKPRSASATGALPSPLPGAAIGMMTAGDAGYARAVPGRRFNFPVDHGSHPDFRTEWWYFTGNLQARDGRRFGFQLTLFRLALAPAQSSAALRRTSRFATRQAWMGHFALSDVDGDSQGRGHDRHDSPRGGGRFHAFERLERGAAGLAGASVQPFRVWVRDWQVTGAPGFFPLRLRAAESGISVDLSLQRGKALVLQGDAGFSRKSGAAGSASYYYSYTRLPVSGRVRTSQGEFQVTGLAWLDREWSSAALASDQSGWDWFALHLDDGRDLMAYRLRDRFGKTHPFSAGMLVAKNGTLTPLRVEQLDFEPGRVWRAPDGENYPVMWDLRAGALRLQVRALFDAQAHRGRFRYWEGAVQARGRDGDVPVTAQGYLEMTGYQEPGSE